MKRPFSPLVTAPGALTVPATEFKAQCLAMLQAVNEGRTSEIVITKHGKALARVVPMTSVSTSLFGFAKSTMTITGDVDRTGERWDAEAGK